MHILQFRPRCSTQRRHAAKECCIGKINKTNNTIYVVRCMYPTTYPVYLKAHAHCEHALAGNVREHRSRSQTINSAAHYYDNCQEFRSE